MTTESEITMTLRLLGTTTEIYTALEDIQQFLMDSKTLSELATALNTEKSAYDIRIKFVEKEKVEDGNITTE